MTKIEAIIRPDRLDEVKAGLDAIGVKGMTVTNVMGCGSQKGRTEYYRGHEHVVTLLEKVKLETVVLDDMVQPVTDAIVRLACTGEIGDGKIFLSKVADAVRIRTGERGDIAIS